MPSKKDASHKRTKPNTKTQIKPETTARYRTLQRFLDKQFPDVTSALLYKTPFQLLVATIMSAQCTDTLVNKVTPALFKKYPNAKAFAAADLAQLQKDIYPVTFYNTKAKSIRNTAQILEAKFHGKVPKTIDELISLPGVARKTANVVLGHAYGITSGFVVDTHVMRFAHRYGFSTSDDPKKIEQDMMAIVPKKRWVHTADQIIWFGRTICTARFDKCKNYPVLRKLCPEAIQSLNVKSTKDKSTKSISKATTKTPKR